MKEQDAAHSFEKFEGHTPGPWEIDDYGHGVLYTHDTGFKFHICLIGSGGSITMSDEEEAANLALIAATPSLLAELTRLRSELQTLQSALDHCKEVGSIRQDLIAEQKSELQQKDEAVLELSEILVIAYDALSVVRTEPTMSGSVLASFDKNKFIKIRGDFFEFLDKHKTLESLIKKAKLNN